MRDSRRGQRRDGRGLAGERNPLRIPEIEERCAGCHVCRVQVVHSTTLQL